MLECWVLGEQCLLSCQFFHQLSRMKPLKVRPLNANLFLRNSPKAGCWSPVGPAASLSLDTQ